MWLKNAKMSHLKLADVVPIKRTNFGRSSDCVFAKHANLYKNKTKPPFEVD